MIKATKSIMTSSKVRRRHYHFDATYVNACTVRLVNTHCQHHTHLITPNFIDNILALIPKHPCSLPDDPQFIDNLVTINEDFRFFFLPKDSSWGASLKALTQKPTWPFSGRKCLQQPHPMYVQGYMDTPNTPHHQQPCITNRYATHPQMFSNRMDTINGVMITIQK